MRCDEDGTRLTGSTITPFRTLSTVFNWSTFIVAHVEKEMEAIPSGVWRKSVATVPQADSEKIFPAVVAGGGLSFVQALNAIRALTGRRV